MSKTVLAGLLVLGLVACSRVAAREPARDAGNGKLGDRALDRTLVVGTLIEATIEDSRAGRRRPLGQTLAATVSADVKNAHRWVVIPVGSPVGLRIAHWGSATSESQAEARITLEVLSVTVRGRLYPVRATVEPSGKGVVVAPGTRILFVLSEGFTAVLPRGELP
ncbi:MAG TPA: hypothetical protein VGA20_10860 [Gemmatimonadales bacterium]